MSQQTKVDVAADTVAVDPVSGRVRVDGVAVFRLVVGTQGIMLQIMDGNRMRCECLQRRYIEIPLERLVKKLEASV